MKVTMRRYTAVALTMVAVAMGPAYAEHGTPSRSRADILTISANSQSSAATSQHFPNVTLRTQDGTQVRFYDDLMKGKIVLINFMFTSCTSACPLATANLIKVEKALGEHLGREVVMISITVDPDTDTPDVLKKYSVRYGTKPGWYFVTGTQKDIDLVRRRLRVYDDNVDKTQHTGIVIYGNESTGQWASTPAMADPRAIVRSVMRLLDLQKRSLPS